MKLFAKPDPRGSSLGTNPTGSLEQLLSSFSDAVAERVVKRLREQEAPRLMNARQAGEYLGRSERWIRQETAAGRLECVREGNSRPRYDRAALDRYVEQHNGRD